MEVLKGGSFGDGLLQAKFRIEESEWFTSMALRAHGKILWKKIGAGREKFQTTSVDGRRYSQGSILSDFHYCSTKKREDM